MRPRKTGNHHGEHLGKAKWILFCDQKWGFSDLLPYFARGEDLQCYQQFSKEPLLRSLQTGFILWANMDWVKQNGTYLMKLRLLFFPFWYQTCSLPPFQLQSSSLSKFMLLVYSYSWRHHLPAIWSFGLMFIH